MRMGTSTVGGNSSADPELNILGEHEIAVQEHIDALDTPESIEHVLSKLQKKLAQVATAPGKEYEEGSSSFLPLLHRGTQNRRGHSLEADIETINLNDKSLLNDFDDAHRLDQDANEGVVVPIDTITLVSSMFVMIAMGLAMFIVIDYLTKRRNKRLLLRSGLKTMGDHMFTVTKTLGQDNQDDKGISSRGNRGLQIKETIPTAHPHSSDNLSFAQMPEEEIFKPARKFVMKDKDFDCVIQTSAQEAHNRKLMAVNKTNSHL